MLSNAARNPGRLGRLTAQFPEGLRDLTWYAAGNLPTPPASIAVPGFPDWGMLSNDTLGCCGVAGLQHLMEAAATDADESEQWPTADQVASYYLNYTGGQDTGVVLSQFLAYVRQNGYMGHAVAAYAPVSVSDVPTLETAVYLYDAAYCGITVTAEMQQAFADGQPWTLQMAQGEPVGGHCVPAVAYDDNGLTVITWGQPQVITWAAWHYMASEAWAVLTGEITSAGTDGHGVSLAALQADLDKLDGPAPALVPPANPGLLGELSRLVREIAANADRDISEAVAWIRERGL